MLAEGSLDSLLWEMIRPFYIHPLSVSQGELRVLMELFPDLPGNLPVKADALKTYEPWNEEKIALFFKKYPSLLPFSPLLSFNLAHATSIGTTGFVLHKSGNSGASSQYMHFSLNPWEKISFQARADLSDAVARWQRRCLSANPTQWCEIKVGNFDGYSDQGILFGYFLSGMSNSTQLQENWLYGNAAAWNGIAISLHPKKISSSSRVIFHYGKNETIYGVDAAFNIAKAIRYQLGISHLYIPSTADHYYYCHNGLQLKWKHFSTEMHTALDFENPDRIPVVLKSSITYDVNRFQIKCISLPSGYDAPRSKLLHHVIADQGDTLLNHNLVVSLQTAHRFHDFITFAQEFTMQFVALRAAYLRTSLTAKGALAGTDYRCTYTWTAPSLPEELTKETIDLAIASRLNSHFHVKEAFHLSYHNQNRYSYRFSLNPEFTLRQSAAGPVIKLHKRKEYHMYGGIVHHVELFEKTRTEMSFEYPFMRKTTGEKASVRVKMWFLL